MSRVKPIVPSDGAAAVDSSRWVTPPNQLSSGRTSRRVLATCLWLVVIANAGVIVWLWLHGGGVGRVHGSAALFTSLGRITGLIAVYLALVQVLLIARVPPVEGLVGFDRLTVWHRRNGKVCIYFVVAHTVLITVGYAGSRSDLGPTRVLAPTQQLPGDGHGDDRHRADGGSRDQLAGDRAPSPTVRGVVFRASLHLRRDRADLPAPAAHRQRVHHQSLPARLLDRSVRSDPASARLLPPRAGRRGAHFTIACASPTSPGRRPGVVSLRITGRNLDHLHARAGQFMLWRFFTRGRWWQAHPFSLSAAPDGRSLRLTVKDVGNFTSHIADVPLGTVVLAEGPFGTFTAVRRTHPRVALIAGGIGITPLRALFEELPAAPGELALIYRVISERGSRLPRRAGGDRSRAGRRSFLRRRRSPLRQPDADLLSPAHLRQLIPDIAEREVYLCGPGPMMIRTEGSLLGVGVPSHQIHSERFALAA